jgi:flagellar biosynthesis protein FlhG
MSTSPSRRVTHQARELENRVLRPRKPSPWIAVSGGKGGVGKTLVAVNLAILMTRAGYRALLVDLDPGLANVNVHLRLAPEFTVEDLAAGACSAEAAIVEGPAGLHVIAGRSGSPRLASGDLEFLEATMGAVSRAAKDFDVVICDTGAGIGPAVMATAERADLVMAITTPEPSSITDTYAMCKVLHTAGRPLPSLVINRVRSREDAMRTAGKLSTVCERFLGHGTGVLGWLQSNPMLERSVLDQRPFSLHGSGPALEDLRAITASTLSALPNCGRTQGRRRKQTPYRLRPG